MRALAADIGATHSRLAWVDGETRRLGHYRNAEFSDLYQVIERFLHEQGLARAGMDRMVLALPGAADPERVRLTNIDWQVERATLQARFDVARVRLLNDFQAAAVGALHAPRPRVLQRGRVQDANRCAVVTGVGTGLGLAWCADTEACGLPQATEGGHADFAPAEADEYALHAALTERHGHVSWERVLSGPGLGALYAHFHGEDPGPAEVQRRAEAGEPAARGVLRRFVRLLARYAGNLALQFNPGAGVYLCGGVVAHLADWIAQGFAGAFSDKGRMRTLLQTVPVYLVDDPDVGLRGAIRIAREVSDEPA